MHNTKNSFLKMLKIYSQLKNTLKKFLNIKSIIVLKMETRNLIKNEPGKQTIKSYLIIGKIHEDLQLLCFSLFSFSEASLKKINEDIFMSHLRFKNLFKVLMITHATIQ